jgi:hypothetical protein
MAKEKFCFATAMHFVPGPTVRSMISKVRKALDERTAFEEAKKPGKLHVELRDAVKQLDGNALMARFYCVLKADPMEVLNKERKEGYRANLKTVRKVRMTAEYLAGDSTRLNGVCKALFAATILAARLGKPWVSNNDAEKLLLSLPVTTGNAELTAALKELQGMNIENASEARNQACQFRTAFENLNCYRIARGNAKDLSANGIYANLDSPLIMALADRWGI